MRGQGRPNEEKMAAIEELSERPARMDARLDTLWRRRSVRPMRGRPLRGKCIERSGRMGRPEDCAPDPEELRKSARQVRWSGRGH